MIKRHMTPTTTQGEAQRQSESLTIASPDPHQAVRFAYGSIVQVHPERPRLVKAVERDGAPIANGNWLELAHSPEEIAERWGTIQVGFKVYITYLGPSGQAATATIVASPSSGEQPVKNEATRGLFAIFPPGSGL